VTILLTVDVFEPYLCPRFKQYVAPSPDVCAPRGPNVSRFLFEPAPGRGDLGRTTPGRCPISAEVYRYGKG